MRAASCLVCSASRARRLPTGSSAQVAMARIERVRAPPLLDGDDELPHVLRRDLEASRRGVAEEIVRAPGEPSPRVLEGVAVGGQRSTSDSPSSSRSAARVSMS